MCVAYEVTLGPGAIRSFLSLAEPNRKELADALRTELLNGPNASKELGLGADGKTPAEGGPGITAVVYTATPLSFDGCTVLHREMTGDELGRLSCEQGRPHAGRGFYVIDILAPELAVARGARRA